MNRFSLAVANIRHRRSLTGLTILSVALAATLVSTILLVHRGLEDSVTNPGEGYGLVVGPRGSRMGLVLSSVFSVDVVDGVIPREIYDELQSHPSVALAVPFAVGDRFHGYPVLATAPTAFSARMPSPVAPKFASGRAFAESGNEAVVGAEVAAQLGIRVGDEIEPSHGTEEAAHEQEVLLRVVGVLNPSHTAWDRMVFIPTASFFAMSEHARSDSLSYVLVFPRGGMHKAILLASYNNRTDLLVADIPAESQRFLELTRGADKLFVAVSLLVVLLSALSLILSTLATMSERKRDTALLRALGASRTFSIALVLIETALTTSLGMILGALLARCLLAFGQERIANATGIVVLPWRLDVTEIAVLSMIAAVAAFAATLPALGLYRSDRLSDAFEG